MQRKLLLALALLANASAYSALMRPRFVLDRCVRV